MEDRKRTAAAEIQRAAGVPVDSQATGYVLDRLRAFVRKNSSGGCKILSAGAACLCPLCDLDRAADALRWYGEYAAALARDVFEKKTDVLVFLNHGGIMTCKKHRDNPARGYCPCEGCEIDRLNKVIDRARAENGRLRLTFRVNILRLVPGIDPAEIDKVLAEPNIGY